jgi:CelD/BcsL family acetyltransferase involved in cellulose biosynthesis
VTPAWRIVEYPGLEGLRRLEADWKRLEAAMPDRAAHHTYESHLWYFTHLGPTQGAFTSLALSDGERIRAICPLERATVKILGRRARVWRLPWQVWDLQRDVVCPPGEAEDRLLPQVLRHVRGQRLPATWLVFDRVLGTSALWRCLRSVDPRAYCADVTGASAGFDCERSFEELSSRFSKKFRANLRYAGNKLAALEGVRFVTSADPESVAREFETFLEVEASGWKGEGGMRTAIRNEPVQLAFYRHLATTLGAAGHCEINALYADGRCIASQLCLRVGAQYAIPKLAYDERYAQVAPGQLLLERTLMRCCDDPAINRLSMVSDAEWFRPWHMDYVPVHCVYVPLGRWSGPALLALLRLRFGFARRAKNRLLRLRIVSKMAQGVRRRATGHSSVGAADN